MMASKINKTMGLLLLKLKNVLPRLALTTVYKAFVRPHLDFGDIICDEACNASFTINLKYFNTMLDWQ